MFTLRKNELWTFKSICRGDETVPAIAKASGASTISTYRAVQSLSSKHLVKGERQGKRIRLTRSAYGHSMALAAFLEGKGRSIEPLIGSRLPVLLSVSSNPKGLDRVAHETWLSRESARRVIWELRGLGVAEQDRRRVGIPATDTALTRFLRDFSKGACEATLESLAPSGNVLWSEGLQFVFSASRFESTKGVSETGMTAMAKRGLAPTSYKKYYHYAYWRPRLRVEDIALHNILIDPCNPRGVSHSLMFLIKEGFDRERLTAEGGTVGEGTLAELMARYLEGNPVDDPRFPSRSGMTRLCTQYHVR